MYFTQPLPFTYLLISCIAALILLITATVTAPWRQLAAKPIRQHMWLGGIIVLGFSWHLLSVKATPGLVFHPMFITTLYFLFGGRLTFISAGIALLLTQLLANAPLMNWGLNYLIGVVIPTLTIACVLFIINKIRQQNLFIYMLGGGFFGSILSVVTTGTMGFFTIWLIAPYYFESIQNNIPMFFVMIFPEGFCNGAIISTATVLNPNLLKTYDDEFYLQRRPPK